MRSLDDMLALSSWTKELPAEQLDRVRAAISVREFAAGACICRKGDPANAWLGVVDGLVKIHSLSPVGKSVTFAGIPAGSHEQIIAGNFRVRQIGIRFRKCDRQFR